MKKKCEKVVFAWGNFGYLPQWLEVMIENPMCFKKTKMDLLNTALSIIHDKINHFNMVKKE